jgi:hypothetical protein
MTLKNLLRSLSPLGNALAGFFMLALAIGAINHQVLHLMWPEQHVSVDDLSLAALNPRWQGGDSWFPMAKAITHLTIHPNTPLYQALFFEQRTKFIYAPTSLLTMLPTKWLYPENWRVAHETGDYYGQLYGNAFRLMNFVSFALYLLSMILTVLIFRLQMERVRPGWWSGQSRTEKALTLIAVFGLAALFFPMLRTYTLGQLQAWINGLFALALVLWLLDRRALAGLAIGLAALMKPQMGVFLVWALIRRDWRFVVGFAATFVLGCLLSVGLFGIRDHLLYPEVLRHISRTGEAFFPNQSLNGLLHRLLFNGDNLNWSFTDYAPYHPFVYYASTASSVALLLLIFAWKWKVRRGASPLEFAAVALSATLAAPIAWMHHFGILPMIFAVATPSLLIHRPAGRRTGFWLAASYLLTAFLYRWTNELADTPFNFLQSYVFFGAVIVLVLILATTRLEPSWRRTRSAITPADNPPPPAGPVPQGGLA